jgi:creatine kinase
MDVSKITGGINPSAPVRSTRIRVGRNLEGFGLSAGISKNQRLKVEVLMKKAFAGLQGNLAGHYYPLLGMEEDVRQQLIDDHLLFVSGDANFIAAGIENDWPEGRGIFHNASKTFLTWVNEEDQLRIISMEQGGDVKAVFTRLANGINAIGESVYTEYGKNFQHTDKYGYLHSCPTNLGTGMRASVHIDLPGWTAEGLSALKQRCEELNVQSCGTRGEMGGQTGSTYDISNKHRLGYTEVQLVQTMIDSVNTLYEEDLSLQEKHHMGQFAPFPEIKSQNSLVARHLTEYKWKKLNSIETKTSGFTLAKAIACAVQFEDQHCGIYAGDEDSYTEFKDVFDPIICEYHRLPADFSHTSDMDGYKINGTINANAPVHSTRIRVGRSIEGFGLSPGITQEQRVQVESLMKKAFAGLEGELAGEYYPLVGMQEETRQQLVDDHFMFISGDKNLIAAGMERDWPEGRGIFHNDAKTFLTWVNEEDQLRIISMEKGGDINSVFTRLGFGITAIEDSVKSESGKSFQQSPKYGYLHSCPTNLGTGMRASVHIDLPGWTAEGLFAFNKRCGELKVQARGMHGESGGQTGCTYDISNKHRLGYTEVQLVQTMIDSVNTLYQEDLKLQEKHMAAQVVEY